MIAWVIQRAQEAKLGPVLVAAAEPEIAEAARKAGAEAVLTDPDLPSVSIACTPPPKRSIRSAGLTC